MTAMTEKDFQEIQTIIDQMKKLLDGKTFETRMSALIAVAAAELVAASKGDKGHAMHGACMFHNHLDLVIPQVLAEMKRSTRH